MPPRAKPPTTGVARIPKRSMGFYRDPASGEKYRSVTTILSQGIAKEALVFWAGNTVAQSAMDNIPYLIQSSMSGAGRTEAYDWLRRAHTRMKDSRAEIGSAVHSLIESHILGQPVPESLMTDEEIAPYLANFLAFVRDYEVEFTASEMVVAHDGEMYAGTLDYLFRSPKIVRLLIAAGFLPEGSDEQLDMAGDTKTGGEICLGDGLCVRSRPSEFKSCDGTAHSIRGVFGEIGLQMAAYRAARSAWLRDGTRVEMPSTHPAGVGLHLRPEGHLVIPVRCGEEQFTTFCFARKMAEWCTEGSKNVLGDPLVALA